MVQTSTKNQSVLQPFVGAVLMTFIGIFVNRGLQKKTVAVYTKLSSLVKTLLMKVVFQGNFIQVGRVLRRSFSKFSYYCSFHSVDGCLWVVQKEKFGLNKQFLIFESNQWEQFRKVTIYASDNVQIYFESGLSTSINYCIFHKLTAT